MIWKLLLKWFSKWRADYSAGLTPRRLKRIRPGIDTTNQVIEVLGPATMTFRDATKVTWEYACTPFGTENYMIDFDDSGKVLRIRQTLAESSFARIVIGMDKDEVRRVLGKAAHELFFPLSNETVWDWKIVRDNSGDTYFNVHFDASGRVLRTSRNIEARG